VKRLHKTAVLTRLHLKESLLSPAFYIAAAACTLIGYVPVRAFILSIGSQGINPSLSPLFGNVVTALQKLFSEAFVNTLFAQGPFLFALYCAFLPMILYISFSTIITYHFQRDSGAIELLSFGPIQSAGYLASLYFKDLILSAIYLIYLCLSFWIMALINNLVLGPAFFGAVYALALFAVLMYCWARLSATVSTSTIGSMALFIALMLLFAAIQVGSFAVVRQVIHTAISRGGWVLKWLSPFFYSSLIQQALELGKVGMFIGLSLIVAVLASALSLLGQWFEQRKELLG